MKKLTKGLFFTSTIALLLLIGNLNVEAYDGELENALESDVVTESDVMSTVARANHVATAPTAPAVVKSTTQYNSNRVWKRFSITALGGFMDTFSGSNFLKGRYSTGLAMGVDLTPRLSLEGTIGYSEYKVPSGYFGYAFGSHYYYDTAYNNPGYYGYASGSLFDKMRQFLYGGDLIFRVFGRQVLTPLLGTGLTGIANRYYVNDSYNAIYSRSFTRRALAWNGLAGLELNLGKSLALTGRFKFYSLISERSKYTYYNNNTGSNNEYYQVLGGLTFRM